MAFLLVRATDGLMIRVQPLEMPQGEAETFPGFAWVEVPVDFVLPSSASAQGDANPAGHWYLDLDSVGSAPTLQELNQAVGQTPFPCLQQAALRNSKSAEVVAYRAYRLAKKKAQALKSEPDQVLARGGSVAAAQAVAASHAAALALLEADVATKKAALLSARAGNNVGMQFKSRNGNSRS